MVFTKSGTPVSCTLGPCREGSTSVWGSVTSRVRQPRRAICTIVRLEREGGLLLVSNALSSSRKNRHRARAVATPHGVRLMQTFKSQLRYLSAAIGFVLVATLSGCVMIPYETPEAKAQIQHDLKLDPSDIQAVSETNWCFIHTVAKQVARPRKAWGC